MNHTYFSKKQSVKILFFSGKKNTAFTHKIKIYIFNINKLKKYSLENRQPANEKDYQHHYHYMHFFKNYVPTKAVKF